MIDATGLYNFKELLQRFKVQKKRIILTGVNKSVFAELERYGIIDMVGEDNVIDLFDDAVRMLKAAEA
jgi:anti-anti-sigma regulatory factor